MDNYITGEIIKELRKKQNLTQLELANLISVSDKTISKWETGRGLPDINILELLSKKLNISINELMYGKYIVNMNKSNNMLKSNFYVCNMCGNIILSMGDTSISCCGTILANLDLIIEDEKHFMNVEIIENEVFVSINHEMSKEHYISFIAYLVNDRCEIVKLYPQQNAETRFFYRGKGLLYTFCNKDGLFVKRM